MSRGQFICSVCGEDFHDHCVNLCCYVGYHNVLSVEGEIEDCDPPFVDEELRRLKDQINHPHIDDFIEAIRLEAVHQRERWGTLHDERKEAPDWFWLLGYLSGKILSSWKAGDEEKMKHHIITTAAACLNWHESLLKKGERSTSTRGQILFFVEKETPTPMFVVRTLKDSYPDTPFTLLSLIEEGVVKFDVDGRLRLNKSVKKRE